MPSPTLEYFLVTQTFEAVITNAQPGDTTLPTVVPISGTITFSPQPSEIESSTLGETVMLDPLIGRWDADTDGELKSLDGATGVSLVDNQNLDLDDGALTYRVDYSNLVWDSETDHQIRSFRFAAPGDGSAIDLTTVDRLPL